MVCQTSFFFPSCEQNLDWLLVVSHLRSKWSIHPDWLIHSSSFRLSSPRYCIFHASWALCYRDSSLLQLAAVSLPQWQGLWVHAQPSWLVVQRAVFSPALSSVHRRWAKGAEMGHAEGVRTSREKHGCCLLAEGWYKEPKWGGWVCAGEREQGSVTPAGIFGHCVMELCVSSPADVVAPAIPQLQVPPCVWQTCQQGEMLWLCAHHPQCPRQPLLRCEPPLHCSGDWMRRRRCFPCHSHPPGELHQGEPAFQRLEESQAFQGASLWRGDLIDATIWTAKWWKRPQMPWQVLARMCILMSYIAACRFLALPFVSFLICLSCIITRSCAVLVFVSWDSCG